MARRRATRAEPDELDEEVEEFAAVTPQPLPTIPQLVTPCTLAALENWLKDVQVLSAGMSPTATVVTTGPNIRVS